MDAEPSTQTSLWGLIELVGNYFQEPIQVKFLAAMSGTWNLNPRPAASLLETSASGNCNW